MEEFSQTAGQPVDGYQQESQPSQQFSNEQSWDFLNQNFKSFVPPQYQELVAKYNSFSDFLDSYHAQQSLVGKKVSDYASSDWKTYASMINQVSSIPADPSGYSFEHKEGSLLNEEDDNLCRDIACNMGLTNEQANLLYKFKRDIVCREMDTN